MGLFKRAHVRGINFELVRQGLIAWPSEKISEEAADAIADNMPEEELPEVSEEEGLTEEEAANVIEKLVEVADEIAEQTGGVKDASFNKIAAEIDPYEAAILTANDLIEKAAMEAGTDVTGDGRFQEDNMSGGMANIDAVKDPSAEKVVSTGTTQLDTSPGAVGAEKPTDDAPGATAITDGEVAKLSQVFARLRKAAGEEADEGTAPGAGDTSSPAYDEPTTNIKMDGAIAQGQTGHPKGPQIGEQTPNPAMSNPVKPTSEVAKLSSLLNRVLKQAEEEEKKDEFPPVKEEKKEDSEEKKEDAEEKKEETKEAADLLNALRIVARHLPQQ